MKLTLISATSILSLAAAGAFAQDATVDWNGWYAGAVLGATQHKSTYEDRDYDWFGHTMDLRSLGASVGISGGYNVVNQNGLLGVVADLSYTTNEEEDIYSSRVQIQNDSDLLATLRGRAGIAVDNTLLFVTGGLAYANFERSWTEFDDVTDSWPDLGDGKVGAVVGFGLERAIDERWSVAGTFTTSIFDENSSTNAEDYEMLINDRVHRLGLSVNYKLGDVAGQAPAASSSGTPADFSGVYAGARLGAAAADIATSDVDYNNYGGTYDVTNSGALAVVSAGYNWQLGATVVGLEANVGFGDLQAGYEAHNGDLETQMDQIIGLRGRAGMAAGNTLLYVLGGISTANVTNLSEDGAIDLGDTYTGITVGAGVEQFISNNLSWVAEGTYTLFDGSDDADSSDSGYYGTADLLTLTGGVNYYIGGEGRRRGTGALAPSHDWSGPYAGFDVGLLANEGEVTDIDYEDYGGTFNVVSLGAGAGVHAGYNWQNGSFVYGVVADVAAFSNDEEQVADDYREVTSRISAMGTLRGRAGIASGNSLFYATGGLGLIQSELEHNYLPAPDANSFDLSDTRLGAVVGLGIEHALSDSMSFKIETLYFASSDDDYSQDPTEDCNGPTGFDGGDCGMIGVDTNVMIKASVSYKF